MNLITEKRIVITNAQCLTKEQYDELTNYLNLCPIEYEEQDISFSNDGTI